MLHALWAKLVLKRGIFQYVFCVHLSCLSKAERWEFMNLLFSYILKTDTFITPFCPVCVGRKEFFSVWYLSLLWSAFFGQSKHIFAPPPKAFVQKIR